MSQQSFRRIPAQLRKGEALGRKELARFATLGTPDTILRWYRPLAAKKYDVVDRYFVLFVIDLKTRRFEIAGIVHQPHEACD